MTISDGIFKRKGRRCLLEVQNNTHLGDGAILECGHWWLRTRKVWCCSCWNERKESLRRGLSVREGWAEVNPG